MDKVDPNTTVSKFNTIDFVIEVSDFIINPINCVIHLINTTISLSNFTGKANGADIDPADFARIAS